MRFLPNWRCNRRGGVEAVALGLSLLASVLIFGKARKASPSRQLSVLRMRIVQTAKDVEAINVALLMDKDRTVEQRKKDQTLYIESKNRVLKATRIYNKMRGDYAKLKKFARSDREQVVALLVATARAFTSERRSGNE
ncbi:MAG: hypothetical protein AMS21_00905 [Gemmatimonas sp. SG8_38_2]|nr:MAG: hypothetical protein AMS21_00905 [Gemmatimonas sp. SG8_38_2]